MQKLSLTKRPAQIGPSINTRTQRHGDEQHPAIDIPLTAIPLTEEELGGILGDVGAYDALFTKDRSKFAEPRFPDVTEVPVDAKYKGAKVTLTVHGNKLIFKPATVQKIKVLLIGSSAVLAVTISGEPPEDGLDVLDLLNAKCDLAILNGQAESEADQPQLGLEGGGMNEGAAAEETDPETLADVEREEQEATDEALGRKPRRAAKRK